MDHGEDLKSTIAREMHEEVRLQGDFTYKIIAVDEPTHLQKHNFWQLRLIFRVQPDNMSFSAGDDGDEIAFIKPDHFKDSDIRTEQRIYDYSLLL